MEYFYPAIVKHDAKGGIFSVIFPDLNGCQAQGRTAEEAVLKAREALAASLLEMEEKGLEIPPASDERLFRLRYGGSRCCTTNSQERTTRDLFHKDNPPDKAGQPPGSNLCCVCVFLGNGSIVFLRQHFFDHGRAKCR